MKYVIRMVGTVIGIIDDKLKSGRNERTVGGGVLNLQEFIDKIKIITSPNF